MYENKWGFPLHHFHLEISSKCTLKCLRCPRTEHPQTPWIGKELNLEQIKKIMPTQLLQQNVKRLTICGDVGDPIYNSQFLEIIAYFKKTNPEISLYIITNGSYKTKQWWEKLVSILNSQDTVAFSIDGYDQSSNEKYRVNSDWPSIMEGVRVIAASQVCLVWATIAFKFNQESIDKIRQLALEAGADFFQLTKSTKFGSKYLSYLDENKTDLLEPDPQWVSKSHRFERNIENLSGKKFQFIDLFLKHSQDLYHHRRQLLDNKAQVFPLCFTGNRGTYINVTGQMFPCSWVSFPYKKLISHKQGREIDFSESFFHLNADQFNVLQKGFYTVLNDSVWGHLIRRFQSDQPFIECEQKCDKSIVDPSYAVGWFLN